MSIRPRSSTSPTSLRRLPAVAAQASPRVSFLPTAAAIVTWATMPVTRISPSDCSTVPRSSEPRAPTRPAASAPVNPSEPGSRDRLTDQVSTAVTTTGISIATAVTRTAEPTVAFGLKRMIRNAASYMSPSCSGRSAMAPGLWAAPSMPGCGRYGPGYWPGYWGGYPGGAYPGCGYGCGDGWGLLRVRLGRGRRLPAGRRRRGRTVVRRLVAAGARGRVGLGSRHPGILSGPPPRHRVSRRPRQPDPNGFGLRRRLCQDSPVAPAGCRGAAVLDH